MADSHRADHPPPRTLYKIGEIAPLLRQTPGGVYALIRRGILPAGRLGRHLRVDPDALRAFIERGGTTGRSR